MQRRISRSALTLPVLLAATSGYAVAFSTFGGKWPDPSNLYWHLHTTESAYQAAYFDAFMDWNNTPTKLRFLQGGTEQFHGNTYYNANDTRSGYADVYPCFGCIYEQAYLYLNKARLDSRSANVKRGVAGHEIGHGVGLDHSSVFPALMNNNDSRETVYTPQQDDVDGVNFIYGRPGM